MLRAKITDLDIVHVEPVDKSETYALQLSHHETGATIYIEATNVRAAEKMKALSDLLDEIHAKELPF